MLCDLATNNPRLHRRTILYRRYAAIDNYNFTTYLSSKCNFITRPIGDVCCLYDQYCSELSCHHHAPLVQRTVNERPHIPWWCRKLDEMKRQVRVCERKWRRNRTDNHRICYTALSYKYCRTLASIKAAFYCKMIETALNVNRVMFLIAIRFLGRKCANSLPNDTGGPAILSDRFASHFTDNIGSTRRQIRVPSANVYNAHARVILLPLLAFQPASFEKVMALIQNGKIKTPKANTSLHRRRFSGISSTYRMNHLLFRQT